MLLRKEEGSVTAIPQPSHAWLSGQLARAWGNERFAAPVPKEDVCLAAEQHGIGWLGWERRPALDSETGLPQEFFRLPPRRSCLRALSRAVGLTPCRYDLHAPFRFW